MAGRRKGKDGPPGRSAALIWARRILVVGGIGCFGWVAWSLSDAAVVEALESRRLEEARRDRFGMAPGPETGEAPGRRDVPPDLSWASLGEGDLVGKIDIERLGVSAIMLSGTSSRTLRRAVGHIPGTALPGEAGNVGLAGHRDSFFRGLEGVVAGDTIALRTPHGDLHYRVDRVLVVDPDEVHVLAPPDEGEMVTLVTCYPFHYVGPAPRRFIVQGTRVPLSSAHPPTVQEVPAR